MINFNPIALILDLISPPRCARCATRGTWLCSACAERLPRLDEHHCRVCAAPGVRSTLCSDCYREHPPIARITAPFEHRELARTMVLNMKYRGHRHLAHVLAPAMAATVTAHATVVVPVPLHPERKRERGFNQAELLARDVAATMRLPMRRLLTRTRPTPPQAGSSRVARLANVRRAFKAHPAAKGEVVLLVDDVCTTGATLFACAAALSQAGAASVFGVTATRASLEQGH